jgi:hypothetical protein
MILVAVYTLNSFSMVHSDISDRVGKSVQIRGVQLTLMSVSWEVFAHPLMSVSEDTAHAHVSAGKERELYTPKNSSPQFCYRCIFATT